MGTVYPVSTPFLPGRRHPSCSGAPPSGPTPVKLIVGTRVVAEHHRQGSTLDNLIVDTYPDGCEAPPEGSTPVMLVMDEVK